MSLLRRAVVTQKNEFIEGTNTKKGIKVWLLLGYPSNILGYPREY